MPTLRGAAIAGHEWPPIEGTTASIPRPSGLTEDDLVVLFVRTTSPTATHSCPGFVVVGTSVDPNEGATVSVLVGTGHTAGGTFTVDAGIGASAGHTIALSAWADAELGDVSAPAWSEWMPDGYVDLEPIDTARPDATILYLADQPWNTIGDTTPSSSPVTAGWPNMRSRTQATPASDISGRWNGLGEWQTFIGWQIAIESPESDELGRWYFNAADGTPAPGAGWSEFSRFGESNWQVLDNQLAQVVEWGGHVLHWGDALGQEQWMELVVASTTGSNQMGVGLLYQPGDGDDPDLGANVSIEPDGSMTLVTDGAWRGGAPALSVPFLLRLAIKGGTLTVFRNGRQVLSGPVSRASGAPFLWMADSANHASIRFDNLRIGGVGGDEPEPPPPYIAEIHDGSSWRPAVVEIYDGAGWVPADVDIHQPNF